MGGPGLRQGAIPDPGEEAGSSVEPGARAGTVARADDSPERTEGRRRGARRGEVAWSTLDVRGVGVRRPGHGRTPVSRRVHAPGLRRAVQPHPRAPAPAVLPPVRSTVRRHTPEALRHGELLSSPPDHALQRAPPRQAPRIPETLLPRSNGSEEA